MSFNIFGPATKESVRVGYISTDRGFVDNVTICEANDYAKLYPGTQFVFKTRNFIKYLNINEVNKLTPDDIISTGSTCGGIQLDADCGYPQAYFYGGAGVGVQGNPVFGEDGALLAVDLVSGGFGYQYPPLVEVKDNCGIGAGAVTRAVLGEVVETVEYYDQEDDFEEYEICEPTEVGYGLRYGPDGKVLGNWDPTLYANLTKDPIGIQIKEYQDFLQKLQSPWWTTRRNTPLRVTSANRTTRVKHDVKYSSWSDFLSSNAISPVPPSNVPGSDFAGQEFTFEWEEEFPYDGEYVFRAQADNIGRFYLDNEKLLETTEFRQDQTPKTLTKTIKSGVHRIRIDLYNKPIKEKVVKTATPISTEVSPITPIITTSVSTTQPTWYPVGPVPSWNALMDNYAVFPKVKDGVGISDNQNHTLTYTIVIPQDGQYTLEYASDNYGTWSFDGKLVGELAPKNGGDGSTFTKGGKTRINLTKGTYPLTMTVKAISGGILNGVRVALNSPAGIAWKLMDPSGKIINTSRDLSLTQINTKTSIVESQPQKVSSSQPSTQTDTTQTKRVFNTVDYIDKADRKLWRLDPRAGRDSAFINQYGILPFDPNSTEAQSESFSGTHVIRWETIDFPVDGNYNIEVMVDDNVTLYIGNREGNGRVEIGNGLRDVNEGGDEVIIKKRGYSSPGKSTGKSLETRYFKAGKYRIRAELEQINVGPLAKGNPMALAVNIETSFVEQEIISPKSWNENPMGVALTIDAPLPPIPQEPIPQQEGRCPNNPIWTTRFPNGKSKWWPVNYTGSPGFQWSQFMNRYAISPIPPLSKKGSDGGGIVYQNEWEVDIPYDGFYAFKSTVDNAGRILVDDQPVMQANYIPTSLRNTRGGSGVDRRSGIEAIDGGLIYNFRENNPKSKKVFLTKGKHKIQVEVENGITETYEKINKKVFSTKDWLSQVKTITETTTKTSAPTIQTQSRVSPILFKRTIGKNGVPIPTETKELNYTLDGGRLYGPIRFNKSDPGSRFVVYNGGKSIAGFDPGSGKKYDKAFQPGKTNVDKLVSQINSGDATDFKVELKSSKAIGGTSQSSAKFVERGNNIYLDVTGYSGKIELNFKFVISDSVADRGWAGWEFEVLDTEPIISTSKSTSTTSTTTVTGGIVSGSAKDGIVYEGPTAIANYKGDFISPLLADVNAIPNEEIQGKTWIFRWSNVDFPVDGQYTLEAEADDNLIVRVNGIEVGKSKVFEGRRKVKFNATTGKKTIELELSNISIPNTGFDKNPAVGFAEITVPVNSPTGVSKPWTENPIGISAILIPPPCPKKVKGKGVVTEVIVDDPGNGFPRPGTGTGVGEYPVALRLRNVVVEDSGINYSCGIDKIQITPNNGAVLDYECDTFGRIINVKVLNPGLGFTNYPEITLPSDTGINATFRPQFEVVRDPIVEPQKLIQVTDLVGLKQTGYIDGRPYYGAVFYKDGIRYAGFYETPGALVQVYDTLKESVDAKVTTPPSAIQRQGTDISNNDPRLNLPGSPENLI